MPNNQLFLDFYNLAKTFQNQSFTLANRKKFLGSARPLIAGIAVPKSPKKPVTLLSIPALRDLYKGLGYSYSKAFLQDALLSYIDGDFPISNKPVASFDLAERATREFLQRCCNTNKGNKIMCIGPNVGRGKKYKQVI